MYVYYTTTIIVYNIIVILWKNISSDLHVSQCVGYLYVVRLNNSIQLKRSARQVNMCQM